MPTSEFTTAICHLPTGDCLLLPPAFFLPTGDCQLPTSSSRLTPPAFFLPTCDCQLPTSSSRLMPFCLTPSFCQLPPPALFQLLKLKFWIAGLSFFVVVTDEMKFIIKAVLVKDDKNHFRFHTVKAFFEIIIFPFVANSI